MLAVLHFSLLLFTVVSFSFSFPFPFALPLLLLLLLPVGLREIVHVVDVTRLVLFDPVLLADGVKGTQATVVDHGFSHLGPDFVQQPVQLGILLRMPLTRAPARGEHGRVLVVSLQLSESRLRLLRQLRVQARCRVLRS